MIENQITPLEITLSETFMNNLDERLIPRNVGIIIYKNKKK
jgi:hypothetical protein